MHQQLGLRSWPAIQIPFSNVVCYWRYCFVDSECRIDRHQRSPCMCTCSCNGYFDLGCVLPVQMRRKPLSPHPERQAAAAWDPASSPPRRSRRVVRRSRRTGTPPTTSCGTARQRLRKGRQRSTGNGAAAAGRRAAGPPEVLWDGRARRGRTGALRTGSTVAASRCAGCDFNQAVPCCVA